MWDDNHSDAIKSSKIYKYKNQERKRAAIKKYKKAV